MNILEGLNPNRKKLLNIFRDLSLYLQVQAPVKQGSYTQNSLFDK